ncbi:MAG: metal ABC transporter substrate-binding protein [Firmicutes bacterium]|nr:metal ABC transporter substrate-binding protein [Bacillota bacterium]
MKKRDILFIALIVLAIVIPFSCTKTQSDKTATGNSTEKQNSDKPGNPEKSGKFRIVTSILPMYDIAENVGGDSVEVRNLLPPGGSPHTFEPSAEDAAAIENADLMFVVGLGLDTWLEKLAKASGDKYDGKIIALSAGIQTIPLMEEASMGESGEEHADEHKHEHGSEDPHIWMDPANMKKMAENARDALIAAKPELKDKFTANCDAYIKKLDALDKQYKETLDQFSKKEFISFHSFLGYTAKRYGMKQVAVIAADPGKEPDPQHIIKSIEILKKHNVKVVFAEPQFSSKASESIAKEIDGKVVNVDPMGSLSDIKRDTYIKNMEENLNSLVEAFRTEK